MKTLPRCSQDGRSVAGSRGFAPLLAVVGVPWRGPLILLVLGLLVGRWPLGSVASSVPIILEHPASVTAAYGDAASLHVKAIGPNLHYRWERLIDGGQQTTSISLGGDRDTLVFNELKPEHAGRYRVVVESQGYGEATSRECTIRFPADQGVDRLRVIRNSPPVRAGLPVGRGVVLNGKFYYPGYDPESGVELWVTDGSNSGSYRVKDIQPGDGDGLIVPAGTRDGMGLFHTRLYFVADDGQNGRAVWVSDGTSGGTQLLQADFFFVAPPEEYSIGDLDLSIATVHQPPARHNSAADLQITGFVEAGGRLFFETSSSGLAGLGCTDGTPTGTGNILVSEIQAWYEDTPTYTPFLQVRGLARGSGGEVFFIADTPEYGRELWISDGTSVGTHLVRNIGPQSSSPHGILTSSLTPFAGRVFFMGRHPTVGAEPWASDGTSPGTLNLGDIHLGSASSLPHEFTPFRDRVFFSAQSATGYGLWSTDGSATGAILVREFNGGVSRLRNASGLIGGSRLYFTANDGTSGFELWTSDGTADGTLRVADLAPGAASSSPIPLGTDARTLYFLNELPASNRALWLTDGTTAGTVRLSDEGPFTRYALLRSGTATYFATHQTEGGRRLRIFRTDGTPSSTVALADLPYADDPQFQWVDLGARKILNTAGKAAMTLRTGELFVTDGTATGTGLAPLPTRPGAFGGLTPHAQGLLFATMIDGSTAGLYRTDGYQTRLLRTYAASSARGVGYAGPRRAIFAPESADWQQAGLLTTDGTPEGTQPWPLAVDPSSATAAVALGDTFVLAAGNNGYLYEDEEDLPPWWRRRVRNAEPYRIGPTGQPTLLREIYPGAAWGSHPMLLAAMEGVAYFFAGDEHGANRLWRSDGTPAGTVAVADMFQDSFDWLLPDAFQPVAFGNRLYFGAWPGNLNLGRELIRSGGTAINTVHFRDIYPGTHVVGNFPSTFDLFNSSEPAELTPVGNTLFFAATSPQGRELWKTDGTSEGTVQVKNLSVSDEQWPVFPSPPSFGFPTPPIPGFPDFGWGTDAGPPASSAAKNLTNPTNLVAVGGRLYFVARDSEGIKLYRSDGTEAGTVPIESKQTQFGPPRELTSVNDRLYYVRTRLLGTTQLWEYDPIRDEHRAITSLAGGLAQPAQLTASDGRLYFVGDDGTGQKLFVYERVPLIRTHPVSQTLLAQTAARLEVTLTVSNASHVWRRGPGVGTPVGSEPALQLPPASITAQPYRVRVTQSGVGSQTSQPAYLQVLDPVTSQRIQEFPTNWWTLTPAAPAPNPVSAPGTLDATWGISNMVNGSITRILPLPNSKALLAGAFSEIAGQPRQNIARLRHDGTIDPTFNAGAGPTGTLQDAALAPDGKIYIVGDFLTVDGFQRERIARLHPDGAVDLDFKPPLGQSGVQQVLAVLPALNGQVYVAGLFEAWDGHPTVSVARLHPNGSVDTTFSVSNQPNTGGPFRVATLAAFPDASPNANAQLIVGGGPYFVEPGNGFTNQRRHLARLSAGTGAWDPAFNVAPIPTPPATLDGGVSRLAVLSNGSLLAAGIQGGGHGDFDGMVRLQSHGGLDTTFQSGPTSHASNPNAAAPPFRTFALLPNGRIVAGGRFTSVQGVARSNLVQLLADGSIDPSFQPAGGPNGEVTTIAAMADGGILIAGAFTVVDGHPRRGLARVNGNPTAPQFVELHAFPILESGDAPEVSLKVEVSGSPAPRVTWYRGEEAVGTGSILRLSRDDPAAQGEYYAMIENPAGTVLSEPVAFEVEGGPPVLLAPPQDATVTPNATAVFRVTASGAPPLRYQWMRNGKPLENETKPELRTKADRLDAAFDTYTVVVSNALARIESAPARIRPTLAGTRDPCFYEYTLPAGVNDGFLACAPPTPFDFPSYRGVETLAWQPSGHLILGGTSFTRGSTWSPETPSHLVRLTEAGQRAPIIGGHPDGRVRTVAAAPDGSVYLAGDFRNIIDESGRPLHPRRALAKYDAQMAFVPGFAPDLLPTTAEVTALLVQPDGKLLISGTFSNVNGSPNLGVARLLPDGRIDPAFRSGLVYLHYARPMALALQSDGRILIGGQGAYFGRGAPPVGEYRNQLCRLLPDGAWDPSFETAGGAANAGYVENVSRILVLPDQRILITGAIARWGSTPRNAIARLQPNGLLDPTFQPGAGPDGHLTAVGQLPDGRLYVAGAFQRFSGVPRANLVRLHSDGTVDEGFQPPPTDLIRDLLLRPDGSVYLGGSLGFGPFTPNLGAAQASPREWRHPIQGTVQTVEVYDFDTACPGHAIEEGPYPGSAGRCGALYACMNGIVRLRGDDSPVSGPRIRVQPQGSVRLVENAGHTLFVGAEASLPEGRALNYQWSKDGVEIPGANQPTLRLDSVTRAQGGAYSVRVWNELGTVMSEPAVLQVLPTANAQGRIAVDVARRRFEWRLEPKPGQRFSAADAAPLALEVSDDLITWFRVPGGVTIDQGALVLSEEQAAFRAKRFYRVRPAAEALPSAADLDPSLRVSLGSLPASLLSHAREHISAFIGQPSSRTAEERNWENVEIASEMRHLFDPGYRGGAEPAYAELKVVATDNPADERGYILVSLTDEDVPIVEFATHGPTKTDHLLRRAGSGQIARLVRFTPSYFVAEDPAGQPRATLGTAPLRVVGELPEGGPVRTASFNSETGARSTLPGLDANLVPFATYAELRDDFRSNTTRQATRQRRRNEAAPTWSRLEGRTLPVWRLQPGTTQDVLADSYVMSARVDADEEESPVISAEPLRGGGLRLTALRTGSSLLRLHFTDGRVEQRTVRVSALAPARPSLQLGNCAEIVEQNGYAGTGWEGDQRQFHQLDRSSWCPAVGCGPTALAMLFGWWDVNGVPSAFYRLKSGQGALGLFRFDFTSLATADAPKTIGTTAETELVGDVYNDLHGLCNVMCNPFGDSGATMPDQMESAFYEYLARVSMVPLFPPMNEFGQAFVGVHADISYVPPGGMTDWEGGGKFVASGIREGRPGIVGIGLCLCDPPHYALAYGYKRLTAYVGCGDDRHVVETRRFFKLNMGHGSGAGPEWHVAENVWFGLSANLWQKAMPAYALPDNLGPLLGNALGLSAKREVSRPAAAMTLDAQRVLLVEGDNHGMIPTGFNRLRSIDGSSTFTTPLVGGIAGGVFRSGPAVVLFPNGQKTHAFGVGTDQRLWRATSPDAGQTWPGGWAPLGPDRTFQSAPSAALASGTGTLYLAALAHDDSCHFLASRDGGSTWPTLTRSLGGVFKSAPALTTSADGRAIHVFGLGTDSRYWHAYSFNHGTNWAGWWPIGEGVFTSAPAAVMSASGDKVRVFGRGTDHQYWQNTSIDDSVTWFGWGPIVPGAVFSSGPAVVASPDAQDLHIFGRGMPPVVPEGTIPDPARPRIYRARSIDGGGTWPGGFGEIVPLAEAF